ncbi:MAG TPA: sugar ABC transporter ATP-binding protein [Anaerovoracaceae bacterium]|nr:sugar ABC transporter ATP-binding protein [Anaerovoracaceae bacterium]
MSEYVLRMIGIEKKFPGVVALDKVDFDLIRGEMHALVGENGAGKSTLMKVLGGVYAPDGGVIEINDKAASITKPADSIENKIGVIYQEFNLVPSLNVYENLFLGREITRAGLGRLSRKEMLEAARKSMEKLGVRNFDCTRKVKLLSVAMQQLVEIGKAIFNDIDILVMDEPTAVLTDRETESLFRVIEEIRKKGISIIYISHRLEETIALCDRITVLRDGKFVETMDNSKRDVKKEYIVSRMVGRELLDYYPKRDFQYSDETVFEVAGLSQEQYFEPISFKLKKGEVLGFSGLVGAGRTEIMKTIFGEYKKSAGHILIGDREVSIKSPGDAIRHGIAFVPEDRKREGLLLAMGMDDNICLASHKALSVLGKFIPARKRALVSRSFEQMQIRPMDPKRKAKNFSGGNQQKAIIARWIATKPKVFILDEPTRGIDVGAKSEIYTLMNKLAKEGAGIIVVSSELLELIGICDRIIVIREGKISGELLRDEFDQDAIMKASVI